MFNNRLRNFVCEESGRFGICAHVPPSQRDMIQYFHSHDHDVSCHVTTTFRNRRKFAIVYAQHSVLSADIETLNTVKCHEVITNEHRENNYYFYRLSFL